MAGLRLSTGKPTGREVAAMGCNDLVIGEDHLLDRVASGIIGKQAGEARWPLAVYPGEEKLQFHNPLSCGSIPFWKRLQEISSRKNQEWSP